MHLLLVHNYYQHPGGEDDVFATERALLEQHGHRVSVYVRHNDEIRGYSKLGLARLGWRTTWAGDSHAALREILQRDRPDLVHFQNTFPLISPSAYFACREAGVPVVQNINNARLLCPGGNYYRDGAICRDCEGKAVPWRGVLHGCYRHSRAQTAAAAAMLTVHNLAGTFRERVDSYILLSEFYRELFLQAGYPAEKLFVKPCFVPHDPGVSEERDGYALFIGRLSREKGAHTIAEAWKALPGVRLKVRGDGDLLPALQRAAGENPAIELVPRLDRAEYFELIQKARFLVWPSIGFYETFGRVVVEAFAAGVPVVGSGLGACAELVRNGETGVRFAPEDPADLAEKVRWAWEHPAEMRAMGRKARREYETKFTGERNYEMLMTIYQTTLARCSTGRSRAVAQGAH